MKNTTVKGGNEMKNTNILVGALFLMGLLMSMPLALAKNASVDELRAIGQTELSDQEFSAIRTYTHGQGWIVSTTSNENIGHLVSINWVNTSVVQLSESEIIAIKKQYGKDSKAAQEALKNIASERKDNTLKGKLIVSELKRQHVFSLSLQSSNKDEIVFRVSENRNGKLENVGYLTLIPSSSGDFVLWTGRLTIPASSTLAGEYQVSIATNAYTVSQKPIVSHTTNTNRGSEFSDTNPEVKNKVVFWKKWKLIGAKNNTAAE